MLAFFFNLNALIIISLITIIICIQLALLLYSFVNLIGFDGEAATRQGRNTGIM